MTCSRSAGEQKNLVNCWCWDRSGRQVQQTTWPARRSTRSDTWFTTCIVPSTVKKQNQHNALSGSTTQRPRSASSVALTHDLGTGLRCRSRFYLATGEREWKKHNCSTVCGIKSPGVCSPKSQDFNRRPLPTSDVRPISPRFRPPARSKLR